MSIQEGWRGIKHDDDRRRKIAVVLSDLTERIKSEQQRAQRVASTSDIPPTYDTIYQDAFDVIQELLHIAIEGRMICDSIMGQYETMQRHRHNCLVVLGVYQRSPPDTPRTKP